MSPDKVSFNSLNKFRVHWFGHFPLGVGMLAIGFLFDVGPIAGSQGVATHPRLPERSSI